MENDGIMINTPDGSKQVHFILGLMVGDNLGLNSICDFSKSFSSNYFCRFCKARKTLTHRFGEENQILLRNVDNYTQDVETNNFLLTGITQNNILNNINSFHVTTNFCIDVMHDIFESVCHYNTCHIITYYTKTVKILSLETLNFKKPNCNYDELEQKTYHFPSKNIIYLNFT